MTIRRTLTFRVDACPGSPLLEGSEHLYRSVAGACVLAEGVEQFRQELARRFGLAIDGVWMTAPLDAAHRPFFDHMAEMHTLGTACLGDGLLEEHLEDSDSVGWYLLDPPGRFHNRNRKIGPGELLGDYGSVIASDRFRAGVEQAGIRGLTFGPPSYGPIPHDPRSWFRLHAEDLTGRGLDHPWAPPYEPKLDDGSGRIGSDGASNDTADLDRLDWEVAELCLRFPPKMLRIRSFPRVWASALPDADFANLTWVPGGGQGRINAILVRRPAALALIEAGLLDPAMLDPIEVVSRRDDAGVPILDDEYGPLPASLLAGIAEYRTRDAGTAPADPPPEPGPLIPPSEIDGNPVDPDDIDAAEAKLEFAVPPIWRRFLTEVGEAEAGDLYPIHPSTWAERAPDLDEMRGDDATLPARMLMVGSTDSGDLYALDLDHVSPAGDCPLLFFDHEISACVDWWPSTAGFIRDTLRVRFDG